MSCKSPSLLLFCLECSKRSRFLPHIPDLPSTSVTPASPRVDPQQFCFWGQGGWLFLIQAISQPSSSGLSAAHTSHPRPFRASAGLQHTPHASGDCPPVSRSWDPAPLLPPFPRSIKRPFSLLPASLSCCGPPSKPSSRNWLWVVSGSGCGRAGAVTCGGHSQALGVFPGPGPQHQGLHPQGSPVRWGLPSRPSCRKGRGLRV